MHIFAAEHAEEIGDLIAENNSIAYDMTIEKSNQIQLWDKVLTAQQISNLFHLSASLKNEDLYYHTAILVTSNWNKNDDVFRPEIIWAAKNTPVDKPTNDGHDSLKILGHMVKSWAIDDDGVILSEKDKLPAKFHILVGSVIYKVWPSAEEQEEYVEKLIEQIEAGEKYVSMECTFQNFDYAIATDNGVDFVKRNEDTAFLSKYLRAYGGDGTYKGAKIGRAVSEISFCGKGYVDKPANPESVIFTKNDIADFSKAKIFDKFNENILKSEKSGVILSTSEEIKSEKKIMENDFYKVQADELKTANTALAKSLDEIKDKLAASNVSKLEDEIKSLKAQVNDMSEVLTKKSEDITAKASEVADLTKKLDDATKASDELSKTNIELSEKVKAVEVEKTTVARVSTLVAGGFTKEEADEKVKVFASLDDAQFDVVTKEIIEARKKVAAPEVNKENPGNVEAEDLEDVETPSDDVASAGLKDKVFDISGLASKLSAALKVTTETK